MSYEPPLDDDFALDKYDDEMTTTQGYLTGCGR